MKEIELHGQAARDFIELIAAGISIDEAYELVSDNPLRVKSCDMAIV